MKKRVFALLTAVVLAAVAESTVHADRLVSLRLFRGTATTWRPRPPGFQGLIMLIRLLGLEEEALACEAPTPSPT